MESKNLCISCIEEKLGSCLFRIVADQIVKRYEDGILAGDESRPDLVSIELAKTRREIKKTRLCFDEVNYDPNYTGRSEL